MADMKGIASGLCGLLLLLGLLGPARAEPSEPTTVPLWPLYYSTVRPDGSSDVEVLFSLFARERSATGEASGHVVPVFWGANYLHVAPLFWHWNNNYLQFFFPLLYRQSNPNETDWRVLWRLFHYQRQADNKLLEFQPLFMYSRGPESKHFSILWRLFEYERDGTNRTLRLFFSPKYNL
jgi:hypothetical protein